MTGQTTPSERLVKGRADFSLMLGGPLFQLLRRSNLSDDALSMVNRRIGVFVLICWVPLLLLAALQGLLLKGNVPIPFLLDVAAQIRFLIVIPILLGAELIVHGRMRSLVQQFLERNLISDRDMPKFDAALVSTARLRNSVVAEVLLIAFVYSVGVVLIWQNHASLDTTTWINVPTVNGTAISYAGTWFRFVSLPVFQFLLFRWYFRVFVWARFLWLVSRIDLQLIVSHPDRAGGIGFLSNTVQAFLPLIVAHGALFAGLMADHIFYFGAQLTDFKLEVAVLAVFLLCVVMAPLLVFTPQLAKAKSTGRREYGNLAERGMRAFDAKWLRGGALKDESFLGSVDIRSLTDLDHSYALVQQMRTTLISKSAVLMLLGALMAPMLPLVLTLIPFGTLLGKLLGMLV